MLSTRWPLVAALLTTACTVSQTEIPSLTGPSIFALSLQVGATPDILTQDGFSQSSIVVSARGPDGAPAVGVPIFMYLSSNAGSLSRSNVTTNSDGRATVVYTAPLASPFQAGGPATSLWIYARPIGSNYEASRSEHAEVLLLAPPVPTQSANAPVASLSYSPAAPKVGDNMQFDASSSRAGTGHRIASFYWNFGDGQPNDEHGSDASHVYVAPGTYTMTLGVVDEVGQIDSTFRSITVTP